MSRFVYMVYKEFLLCLQIIAGKLCLIDSKTDAAISALSPARLRELDVKRSKDGALPLNERIECKSLIKACKPIRILKRD